jgi:hypothetical protein
VIIVDDEPGVFGPLGEVFGDDLGERLDVLTRGGEGAEVFSQAVIAALDDRRRTARDSERERRDVGR